jgi:tyrosyl-tRNA synthetase
MSTSWGNVINISDEPEDMFGKVMSIRDHLIGRYFLLCTDLPQAEISAIEKGFEMGANPRDAKLKLADAIVTIYHGEKAAKRAHESFIDTFQKGGVPDNALEISLAPNASLADALLAHGVVKSKSEFRRLIDEGAVQNMDDGTRITDPLFTVWKNATFKVGKRRFVKVSVES